MLKRVGNWLIKGTEKQISKIEYLYENEMFESPEFQKYFWSWVHEGTGRYLFPKESYFAAYFMDETILENYALALLKYGATESKNYRECRIK